MTPIEVDIKDYLAWMEVHNYADTTVRDRRRLLASFLAFATAQGVDEAKKVSIELLRGYQEALYAHRKADGRPLAVATQVQRLIPVSELLAWLRREHRIVENPAVELLLPRPERRLPEATLSAEEMALLMGAPDVTRPLGLRDRAVLEVFYSCALRRSELIDLDLGDLDFARGTVFVRCGKGAKDRYVPIGERALFWVRLYGQIVRPSFVIERFPERLFLSSAGTPLCPDWLSRRVRSYLANVRVDKRGSCHLLRHSVATLLLEGGADIRYVAEMLGHARLETTQRYTRVSIDRLRVVHARTHPASGFNVAMASEICAVFQR